MGYEDGNEPLLAKAWSNTAELSRMSAQMISQRVGAISAGSLIHLSRRFGYALVPTYFRNLLWNEAKPAPKEMRGTAWMDGLRGLTALIVFNKHWLFAFTDMTVMPWGADENHRYLVELPFVRLIYSGSSALNFFFAVAGYVVSIKSLQTMSQPNSAAKLFSGLSGSVFRSLFRLYLTVAAITLIWSILAWGGAFEFLRPYLEHHRLEFFPGMWAERNLGQQPSLQLQLAFWFQEMRRLTNIWSLKNAYSDLDPHLWTTVLQFRASMHTYFVLLAVARLKEYARLVALFGFLGLYLNWDRWEIALYMCGAIIAQLHVLRDKYDPPAPTLLPSTKSNDVNEKPTTPPNSANITRPRLMLAHQSHIGRLIRSSASAAGFAICFYLLSYSNLSYKYPSPGFEWLNPLIPSFYSWKSKFWPSVGTVGLIYLLTKTDSSSIYQKILCHWFPQFMGKIMFSFYLVHGNIMHMYGYWIPHIVWGGLGVDKTSLIGYTFGLLVGWACTLCLVMWAADVFSREIDGRLSKLVVWFQGKVFAKA